MIKLGIRLHFGLISMSNDLPRIFGGVGLSVPNIGGSCEITSEKESGVYINDKYSEIFSCFAENVSSFLNTELIPISISLNYPQHCGFGTGTQIRLGIIDVISNVFGVNLGHNERIELSGRGGASGIGISGWNNEGFIFDLGRPNSISSKFAPSSKLNGASDHVYLPTVKCMWDVIVAVPKNYIGLHGEDELRVFKEICPIPEQASISSGYEAIFGLYPAIVEENYANFIESLSKFQNLKWKIEVSKRAPIWLKKEKIKLESDLDLPFFLSSWGPALFSFIEKDSRSKLDEFIKHFNTTNNHYKLEKIVQN